METQTTTQPASRPKQPIFKWQRRPCVVLGECQQTAMIHGHRRSWPAVRLQFIDGGDPRLGIIGKKTWGKQGKLLRGAEALVWARALELTEDTDMTPANAKAQALAELMKGVLR